MAEKEGFESTSKRRFNNKGSLVVIQKPIVPTDFLHREFVVNPLKDEHHSCLFIRFTSVLDSEYPSRLRKKSVRVEIGGIFGDTKPSPATLLALLGQLCAICFSRFLAQTTFSATC